MDTLKTYLLCKASDSDFMAIGFLFKADGVPGDFTLDKEEIMEVYDSDYEWELEMLGITIIDEI